MSSFNTGEATRTTAGTSSTIPSSRGSISVARRGRRGACPSSSALSAPPQSVPCASASAKSERRKASVCEVSSRRLPVGTTSDVPGAEAAAEAEVSNPDSIAGGGGEGESGRASTTIDASGSSSSTSLSDSSSLPDSDAFVSPASESESESETGLGVAAKTAGEVAWGLVSTPTLSRYAPLRWTEPQRTGSIVFRRARVDGGLTRAFLAFPPVRFFSFSTLRRKSSGGGSG
jgi:hypothetical protein